VHLKKIILAVITLFISLLRTGAQDQRISDSLKIIYETQSATDTARLNLLLDLSFNEIEDLVLALEYADELITLSERMRNDAYIRAGYFLKGTKLRLLARLHEALDAFQQSAGLAKKLHNTNAEGDAYGAIAATYSTAQDHTNAKYYYKKSIETLRTIDNPISLASALNNAGDEYLATKNFDSALIYCKEAELLFSRENYSEGVAYSTGNMGLAYAGLGNNTLAEKNINDAINIHKKTKDYYPICVYLNAMSKIYSDKNEQLQALSYASRSLHLAQQYKLNEQIRDANLQLSELYESSGDIPQSYSHFRDYIIYRDTINNIKTLQEMYDLRTAFERTQQKAALHESNQRKKLYSTLFYMALSVAVIIGALIVILFRNYRQKQKAFTMLNEQKTVIEHQRDTTDTALQELKQAQAHLIHSEKMASLGQLTAGIAHEIQNPLNFVNNFSDLNTELVAELYESLKKGNYPEAETMAQEIISNETKISLHGKRAEAIVKGMLEHSRSNASEKRPVNINGLVDEYIRLAVHGIRAKDKSFNVSLQKDFDPAIPELNIVPQEIGRVILNLLNNAFYAVTEKIQVGKVDFIPLVSVTTKIINGDTMIAVKDNGIGIPVSIRQKIFQPFFTTKSPGVGTGLGLSLSYDILKAHGGEMKLESEEGTGSEFVMILPI
jgi:signal transduction histidine kinase